MLVIYLILIAPDISYHCDAYHPTLLHDPLIRTSTVARTIIYVDDSSVLRLLLWCAKRPILIYYEPRHTSISFYIIHAPAGPVSFLPDFGAGLSLIISNFSSHITCTLRSVIWCSIRTSSIIFSDSSAALLIRYVSTRLKEDTDCILWRIIFSALHPRCALKSVSMSRTQYSMQLIACSPGSWCTTLSKLVWSFICNYVWSFDAFIMAPQITQLSEFLSLWRCDALLWIYHYQ